MKLICIRHGQTDWNAQRRLTGKTDLELNSSGLQEVKNLASLLPNTIEAIFSSPLKRTLATAEILGQALNVQVVVRNELRECDFGSLEGMTWPEIDLRFGPELHQAHRNSTFDFSPHGGESAENLKIRIQSFLTWLKTQKYHQVLLVCHLTTIRVLGLLLTGQPLTTVENLSIHELELK